VEYRTWVKHSVVDRHRFDAGPVQDPTFHFDADPDSYPDPDPTLSFTYVGKLGKIGPLFTAQRQLILFIFLVSVIGVFYV
jgi:hypothetical protein